MSWIILLQLSFVFAHGYDGWYQPVPHRPVDIITDVINDLGVRILQQYTAHGNVAFSPTGVGFVLAALYEGSAGRGRQQIADALGLPRDNDITRIGFRDVHRRLRTYLNADGFLGGLTLNQENTKLRPEYEDILRFYGFDLSLLDEEETNGTTPMTDTTVTETSTTSETEQQTSEPVTTLDITTTPATTAQLTNTQDSGSETASTTSPVELLGMTLNTVNLQDRLTQTTSTAGTTILMEILTKATTLPTTNFQTDTTSSAELPSTITNAGIITTTVENTQTIPTTENLNTVTVTTPAIVTDTITSTESILTNESQTMTTSSTIDGVTTISSDSSMNVTQNPTSSTNSGTTQVNEETNGPPADENTVSTDLSNNETTTTTEMGSTDLPGTTAITGETVTGNSEQTIGISTTTDVSMNQVRKRSVRSLRGYFSSYPDEGIWMQDLGIWKPYSASLSEASVRDSTEISFLVNGCDVSSVTAARYIAVLPFAYFPSLHAVALEFPLDDPRYNILLLMSTDRRDTYRLARDLGGKSLRLLRKQLQPTWVRATIPSFMLRGFVTLTSFIERLGILDVFEPRAADLSPMTPDLGVYARDVQQSIGVNIRNYMKPDRTHSRNGLFERAGPVPFTAVHPFLYFIVDVETSVALIAGRVNDPLNSRIL